MSHPDIPGVTGLVTFLYYDDLGPAADFYQHVMGFDLLIDQGWAKLFRVHGEACIGCVDGTHGFHRPDPVKSVLVTILVDDPDAWYDRLVAHGADVIDAPRDNDEIGARMFFARDPGGYSIEIQKFY